MDVFNGKVDLIENIQPTVVSAKAVKPFEIEGAFSENVKVDGLKNEDDFVLSVGEFIWPYSHAEAGDTADKAYIKLLSDFELPELPLPGPIDLDKIE